MSGIPAEEGLSRMLERLRARIDDRSAAVGVAGLGYVGLPLAVEFAKAGFRVTGIDPDAGRVAAVSRGESYVGDVRSEDLAALVGAGRLAAQASWDVAAQLDALVICVPTPFNANREPDLSFVRAAAEEAGRRLRPGQLVVLESTTYPGTTEELLLPLLAAGGLEVGRDFGLAYSPERVDPGNRDYHVANTPKLVGGVTPRCTALAAALYEKVVIKVVPLSSPRVAEMAKLLENIFRNVNIALVNELAMLCDRMGIDVWEVAEAAATKPFGFMSFQPGPGVGGHCLGPEEWVYVRRGPEAGPEPVVDLWEAMAQVRPPVRVGEVEALPDPGLEALGLDEDGRVAWEPVGCLTRRPYAGELVALTTADRRTLAVTAKHPMLVLEGGALTVKLAEALRPGDLLPLFDGGAAGSAASTDPEIDLIRYLSPARRRRTRVRIAGGSWSAHAEVLRREFGPAARDWLRGDYLPLDRYLELEAAGQAPVTRRQLVLWTGRGPAQSSLAAVVALTPDVARLIGYYLSEGCLTDDGSLRVRFTFHPHEAGTVEDLVSILGRLGLRYSTHKDRIWQALHVKVSSNLFGAFLRDALRCGRNSYEMAAPGVLLDASEAHRLALLAGLLRGDGDVWCRTGPRRYRKGMREYTHEDATAYVGYFTASPRLGREMVFLLQSLGFRATLFRRASQRGLGLRVHGAEALDRLRPLLADAKRARLVRYFAGKRRRPRSRVFADRGRFCAIPVATVERRPGPAVVYSLETARTHTFAASYGLLVHNCIPVDPVYLAWKAKEYDFYTNFITRAAEVNANMPHFVVQKLLRLLARQGGRVLGSRVLLLGVTFKRNVADVRNSPALKLLELLQEAGIVAAYHDPLVPRLSIRGGELASAPLTAAAVADADCVVIHTDHATFNYDWIVEHARLVFDTRNATRDVKAGRDRVVRL